MLGEDVELGERISFGCHVVIHEGVRIGDDCTIQDGAVLGKPPALGPRSRAPEPRPSPLVLEAGASVCCHAVICYGAHVGPGAVIGDHVFVREGATIGAGTVVGQGGAIGRGVSIGDGVRLQNNVLIAPGSTIEDDVFFGPLVSVANDPTMGRHDPDLIPEGVTARRGCRVGASAVLLPGIEIGADAVVGAGAVVTRSVPTRTVVIGVPARVVRSVDASDRLDVGAGEAGRAS
jgi:UDP-2-acetamido-3-amino-2,3-dideoxy-glucuronate N-acetyltransferase